MHDRDIDLSSGIMRRRTARWLRIRIIGLLSTDTRLRRALMSEEGDQ